MSDQRRSVIRTVAVASGALVALLLPAGVAVAADTTGPVVGDRTAIMLPDDGLAGLAEKVGHLPTALLVAGFGALVAFGMVGLAMRRRRHDSALGGATANRHGM
ncbi:hypothetical protein [Streptomyces catenulae]|uniref:Uncharacterized protein n=1 Tax=Streptomyces catenulae TaxID=66875 RepID=A0ABV2Z466_9ACTN|nr:hypothetical protein [Streptomyces catenulae]